jgi:hypothetical protein
MTACFKLTLLSCLIHLEQPELCDVQYTVTVIGNPMASLSSLFNGLKPWPVTVLTYWQLAARMPEWSVYRI